MQRSDTVARNALVGYAFAWTAAQVRGAYEPEAFRKGVVAGLLSALPFILFLLLDQPALAVFASLAAVRMGMSDPGRGQAFRHRARVLAAGALCVTAGTFFGTLLADGSLWTLPLVALLVLAAAYLGALGPEGLATSLTVLLPTVVCLGLPGDPVARSAAVIGSCLFVSAVLLCAWPLDPDRPARQATAAALRAVAAMARLLAGTAQRRAGTAEGIRNDGSGQAASGQAGSGEAGSGEAGSGEAALWATRVRAYRAIDQALAITADSLPRHDDGSTAPALLQLAAAASEARRIARALTSMAESGQPAGAELNSVGSAADELERLAGQLSRLPPPRLRHGPALDLGPAPPADALPLAQAPPAQTPPTQAPPAQAPPASPADALRQSLQAIAHSLSADGVPPPDAVATIPMPRPGRTRRLFRWALPLLRDNLSADSSALRHAVRQAVLVAIATGLVWHFQIPHGYWAMLAIVFVTKPAYGGTRQATINRVLATVIGVSAAELVLLNSHDFWVLAPLALLFNCLSHGVVTVNYLIGYAMLTAYVIFKIEAALPGSDLVVPRLLATLLGCALAAASLAVWPP
ncbi:FUSC family protein, partial [Marinibaculum pumilum]